MPRSMLGTQTLSAAEAPASVDTPCYKLHRVSPAARNPGRTKLVLGHLLAGVLEEFVRSDHNGIIISPGIHTVGPRPLHRSFQTR